MNPISVIKREFNTFGPRLKLFFQISLYFLAALTCVLSYMAAQILQLSCMTIIYKIDHSFVFSTLVGLLLLIPIYLAIAYITRKCHYKLATTNLGSLKTWIEIIAWLLVIKISQLCFSLLSPEKTSTSNQHSLEIIFAKGGVMTIYLVLMSLLMAPLVEEFIFRWLAFKMIPIPWIAFIASIIGFTIMHSPNSLFALLVYSSLALVLSINYYRNGFISSYILHLFVNLTALIVML